jgi:ABC-type dipeptide/oligopeptide/nickel transport system permease subunit
LGKRSHASFKRTYTMIYVRLGFCYFLVFAGCSAYVWNSHRADTALMFLFPIVGLIPSLLATICILQPLEKYLAENGFSKLQLPVALVFGAMLPFLTFVIIFVYWQQWPRDGRWLSWSLWNTAGVGWAFLWWVSGLIFRPRSNRLD